jgi:transposase
VQDRDLYSQILGIREPWKVDRIELDLKQGEVNVRLTHDAGSEWPCPECGTPCPLYDHQPRRRWRHLDTCQLRTILSAEPPRSNCPEHGVRTVKLPWAEPGSRFTALFEALAIDWLRAASQKAVAERLGLSWDEVHAIQDRAVKRGLARRKAEPVSRLGVDEKSFTRGHHYFTMVNDLDRSRVLFVGEHRATETLDEFWSSLTAEQLDAVQAVAMDMWDPYVNSTLNHLPEAQGKIVFDKFHIAKHLSEAVDQVRRHEHKQLKARGDDRLAGTRYDWLRHPGKMDPADRKEFAALRDSNLKTAKAWALKEEMMAFFEYIYERPALRHYKGWRSWATRCRLKPIVDKARMIHRRFENIVTYIKQRITNAASESINSKIQWVKYTARGFRSTKNFVTAIYFHCGGLDLMPNTH